MIKENILRELELLPVWQLRKPQSVTEGAREKNSNQLATKKMSAMHQHDGALALTKAPDAAFRIIMSDDASWLFILAQHSDAKEEALLRNILKAVPVKPKEDYQLTLSTLKLDQVKVIVAMGKSAAQALLGVKDELETLRKKTHDYQSVAVVVTYCTQHLLQNLADKAKTWEDLCLAKSIVTSFN